jgi:hypothetical protein
MCVVYTIKAASLSLEGRPQPQSTNVHRRGWLTQLVHGHMPDNGILVDTALL